MGIGEGRTILHKVGAGPQGEDELLVRPEEPFLVGECV